jgi:hypothetical protein
MRVAQPEGARGSLRWMQRAVAERWDDLEAPIAARVGAPVEWRSPRADDDFAEYRDAAFLRLLGLERLEGALADFWPKRGPQWDALGVTAAGQVILVEAKAHVAEFCSPASGASEESLAHINASLAQVAAALGSSCGDLWPRLFYQYANRLAHLWFLREHGVDALLVLVGFTGDREMGGPETAEAWRAAYVVADHALGLRSRHPLASRILHVHPQVRA